MSKVLVSESNLTAIGDAIRAKNETTTKYKPGEMAAAISAIETGGAMVISGNPGKFLNNEYWLNRIVNHPEEFEIKDIYDCGQLLQTPYLVSEPTKGVIPIVFPLKNGLGITSGGRCSFTGFAQQNNYLTKLPTFTGDKVYPGGWGYAFQGCNRLREESINDFLDNHVIIDEEWGSGTSFTYMFNNCYSLRNVPEKIFKYMKYYDNGSAIKTIYNNGFYSCYTLNEIVNLPVHTQSAITSNAFGSTFSSCYRLKNLTFETNADGTPIVAQWKNQTINLSSYIGYGSNEANMTTGYNSGITIDNLVDATNIWRDEKDTNPDWYATNYFFSRYNLDSAIATINSLPDTSEYLATAGGTNTIKFKGDAGGNEIEGSESEGYIFRAIKNLTEEQIAAAAAKGWTVTLV